MFRKTKRFWAAALAMVVFAVSYSSAVIAKDSSEEEVGMLVHKSWDLKLYNDMESFSSGYHLAAGTDYTTGEDMTFDAMQANGYGGSLGITTVIHSNKNQEYILHPVEGKGYGSDFTGAKEFYVWVDTTNVVMRKMFFGFTDASGARYTTDDMDGRTDMSFYIQDEKGWKEMSFDTDGCMPSFGNYKGFVRFSTEYFVTSAGKVLDPKDINGFVVWYDLAGSGEEGIGSKFVVDHVALAGPTLAGSTGKVSDIADNGTLVLPSEMPKQPFDENHIKLRFGALSDLHISGLTGETVNKTKAALQQLKTKAGAKGLDAVLVAGDLTDYGTPTQAKGLKKVVTNALDMNRTKFIFALGNHDYYDYEIAGAALLGGNLIKNEFGSKVYQGATAAEIQNGNYHTTVGGMDFIAVNCMTYSGGVRYRSEDIEWLKAALTKANADHPNTPIFVTAHPMITGTNWGSNYGSYWAGSDLYDILKEYPQAVYFGGHLHFPINDERSIWQGDFTSVGTGSVYYASLESEGFGMRYYDISGSEPVDCHDFSQGLYVEVDNNNNVRLTRMDFYNKSDIKEPWVIPAPKADKSHLNYYSNHRKLENEAPSFAANASITEVSKDMESGKLTISFDAAQDNDMVYSYQLSIVDKAKNKVIKSILMYSDFYRHGQVSGMAKKVVKTLSPGAIGPFTVDYPDDYYYQVTAYDSWGKKSELLVSKDYAGTPVDPSKPRQEAGIDPHRDWDFKLFCDFDKFPLQYQMVGNVDYNSWPVFGTPEAANPEPIASNGYRSSQGVTTKINSTASHFTVYFPTAEHGFKTSFIGAKEFWIWMDTTDIVFNKVSLGFRTQNAYGSTYETDDLNNNDNMTAYIEDGNGGWKELKFDTDGCLSQFGNYKGFIRFRLDYMCSGADSLYPDNLQAFKLGFSVNDASAIGKTFVFDHIGFSGPKMTETDGKVYTLLNETTTPDEDDSTNSSTSENPSQDNNETLTSNDGTKDTSTTDSTKDTSTTNSTSPSNPKTGDGIPYVALALGVCAGTVLYKARRKEDKQISC